MKRTLLLAFAVLLAAPLLAGTLGIDFTDNTEKFKGLQLVGWTFDVDADYHGTALGYYDASPENNPATNEVGIFDSLQNLIVSVVVAPDDPLISFWRWHAVDFNLPAGTGYVIVAWTKLDNTAKKAENFTVDPFLHITGYASVESVPGLQYPTLVTPSPNLDDIYLAPNTMRANETATTPEPGTLILLTAGGVFCAMGLKFHRHYTRRVSINLDFRQLPAKAVEGAPCAGPREPPHP